MTELTNSICRMVKSLDERKTRRKEGAFKAEGTKCVTDTLGHFDLRYLFATAEWIETHRPLLQGVAADRLQQVARRDIVRMSSLVTPPDVIAVYDIPVRNLDVKKASGELVLALDTIQDPGNLGTIIRVADWFGVHTILCSNETADCFAPKVIQSTMGSISRVSLHYGNLREMIEAVNPGAVYGTFLDGESITKATLRQTGIIVIGNEGKGISTEIEETVTERLLIPSYPEGQETGESLNAAVATAITLAKFRGV